MREVTAPAPSSGRWIWAVSGVVTTVVLVIPSTWLITHAGTPSGRPLSAVPTRTITIDQPVTSLNVESYGAPIQIITEPGPAVTVTEAISFSGHRPPAVTAAVSAGELTLDSPACAASGGCSVGFVVTLPSSVNVTAMSDGGDISVAGAAAAHLDSGGGAIRASGITGALVINAESGPVSVAGVAGANIDSGGGAVRDAGVGGPLTVSAEGGPVTVTGVTGALQADSGGGPVFAQGLAATTASVATEGGDARLEFAAPPGSVQVNTGGGAADLVVPGGPYALTTDNGGGPQSVGIAIDPAATRSISVSTSGGPLLIEPAATAGSAKLPQAAMVPKLPKAAMVPKLPKAPPAPKPPPQ